MPSSAFEPGFPHDGPGKLLKRREKWELMLRAGELGAESGSRSVKFLKNFVDKGTSGW